MFYIYILQLENNTDLLISSDTTINKIPDLPEFIQIKQIIKNPDKYILDVEFSKIIKEYDSNVQIIDNLNLRDQYKHIAPLVKVDSDNITTLEKEIEQLTSVRQLMLKYDNLIKGTSINFDNLLQDYPYKTVYSLDTFIDHKHKLDEYQKLSKMISHEESALYYNTPKSHRQLNTNIQRLEELSKFRSKNINIIEITINRIKDLYNFCLNENKIENPIYETDSLLQLYTVKHYNNKMKQKMSKLSQEHGSIESIITKLKFAYSKIFELQA